MANFQLSDGSHNSNSSDDSMSDYPHTQHILDNIEVISGLTDFDGVVDRLCACNLIPYSAAQDMKQLQWGAIRKSEKLWKDLAGESLDMFHLYMRALRDDFPKLVHRMERTLCLTLV